MRTLSRCVLALASVGLVVFCVSRHPDISKQANSAVAAPSTVVHSPPLIAVSSGNTFALINADTIVGSATAKQAPPGTPPAAMPARSPHLDFINDEAARGHPLRAIGLTYPASISAKPQNRLPSRT